MEHFDTIRNSPSQIYHSVLPLSPSSSWLQKCYSTEISHEVKIVRGTKARWGTCSRTVLLGSHTQALSYWNNTIAVGSVGGDIIILDTITGSQMAILSGHTNAVICLTFLSDGKSLISGSNDKTVKLWDIQTGGVVKTFYGHSDGVLSVSISADHTRIASGSWDQTVCLWDIQTGEPICIIKQEDYVTHVSFSPTNPQQIISISHDKIWQWDANGHQIPPTYDGTYIAFSPDHTQFALCNGNVVTVQNSDSRAIVAEFDVADNGVCYCCFSPDGRLFVAAAGRTAYVWDITSPNPYLIETFVGHTDFIASIVFSSPSSLISVSDDQSVKFWQISTLSTNAVTADQQSALSMSPPILSVSLQARAGIAISSDANGVMKTWDISTGLCKETFQTPATGDMGPGRSDTRLIDGRLIFVWYKNKGIHIWDTGKGELLQTLDILDILDKLWCIGLRISGDGSKVFCLFDSSIQAWSMWSWKPVGEVELKLEGMPYLDSLCMDGSRVLVHFGNSPAQKGWDFGTLSSSPIPYDPSTERPHLDFIGDPLQWIHGSSWIKNTVTGKRVFQLSGEYARPSDVRWDGQYLVAGYSSGEVLILDFHHILSRDM